MPWWLGISYKGIGQYDIQDKVKPRRVREDISSFIFTGLFSQFLNNSITQPTALHDGCVPACAAEGCVTVLMR